MRINSFVSTPQARRIERILDPPKGLRAGCPHVARKIRMPTPSTVAHRYAPPELRDRFLLALDSGDWESSTKTAADLVGCTNPLPGMTCTTMQLPIGSTYGAAAARVLQLAATGRMALTNAFILT